MKKGQQVWLVEFSRGKFLLPEQVTVKSVGHKYFEIEEWLRRKFLLKTGEIVSSYVDPTKIYENLQEYEDLMECQRLYSEVKEYFKGYSNPLPLDKLRAIKAILDQK